MCMHIGSWETFFFFFWFDFQNRFAYANAQNCMHSLGFIDICMGIVDARCFANLIRHALLVFSIQVAIPHFASFRNNNFIQMKI